MSRRNLLVPEGWAECTLGEITKLSKEKANPPFDPDTQYISLEHIQSNTTRLLGSGKASEVKSTKAVFNAGDVLYGRLRPYLNKVTIPKLPGVCSTDILVFKESSCCHNRFLLRLLTNSATEVMKSK